MSVIIGYGFGTSGFGAGGFGSLSGYGPPPDYYTALLTSQYQGASPNLIAWLLACINKLDDASQCLATYDPGFDLDQAVGAQLDVLGVLVGASRVVTFQPSGGVSPTLDDVTYRILLRAQLARDQWDGKMDSLQAIWQNLFPGGTIALVDSQNMTVNVLLAGAFSSIIQDLITHGFIVPRPQAVLYTYTFSTLPIFGFDQDGTFIAGFDHGHFA